MRNSRPFCWDEFHHLYLGIFIVLLGLYLRNQYSIYIIILGGYIVLDDIVEHTVTEDTPLRILYEQSIKDKLPNCKCNECTCPTSG